MKVWGVVFHWLDPSATSHLWEEASVSCQPAIGSTAGFSSCWGTKGKGTAHTIHVKSGVESQLPYSPHLVSKHSPCCFASDKTSLTKSGKIHSFRKELNNPIYKNKNRYDFYFNSQRLSKNWENRLFGLLNFLFSHLWSTIWYSPTKWVLKSYYQDTISIVNFTSCT